MASVTFAPPARTFDPPDLIVLAAVAALAAAKAVRRFRGVVLAPGPVVWAPTTVVAAGAPDLLPFDEDLMDRFLTAPADVHDPDADGCAACRPVGAPAPKLSGGPWPSRSRRASAAGWRGG